MNFGIINSITKLHLVGISTEYYNFCFKKRFVFRYVKFVDITLWLHTSAIFVIIGIKQFLQNIKSFLNSFFAPNFTPVAPGVHWLSSYMPFFLWRCDPTRVMASLFLRLLDDTQRRTTVGRTPLDEWSARRRDLYLTTHNTHNRQTSMPPVGFEPTFSAGERPQTYASDRAATGTGKWFTLNILIFLQVYSF